MAETDPRSRDFQLLGDPEDGAGSEPMTFAAFVLSLTTSGLFHLGIAPGGLELPELSEPRVDLDAGRQTIEILEMIRKKTKGNLSADEARLLDNAIHDLHMRYVEVKRESKG